MAKLIPFYVPSRYHQKVRWVPKERRGKLIMFPAVTVGRIVVSKGSVRVNWQFLNRSSRSAK